MSETRPCTCAPDERPYPCQHKYALGLCRKAEIRSLRAELAALKAQPADAQADIAAAGALYASPEARLKAIVAQNERIDYLRTQLELIAHATAPTHDDGAYHEAAHDLATRALSGIAAAKEKL